MTNRQDDEMNDAATRQLDRLIRSALDARGDSSMRPSEKAMLAYFSGVATAAEQDEVRLALHESRRFREELIDLVRDIETLDDPDTRASFHAVEVPEMPPSLREIARGSRGESESTFRRAWSLLRTSLSMDRAAALVGAVLAKALPVLPDPMTPSQFVPILTRGAGDSTVSPTAEEAARRRFLEQVEKVDDALQFVADRDHAAEVVTSKTLSLRLFDETGRHLKTLRASVPEAARDPQAWFLLLPSLTLRSVDMPSDSLSVIWEISLADRGCATFTYQVDGEYEATRGTTFSLEKLN